MSRSLNKVTLIGNLGQDPEIRTVANGGKVATFSLATTTTPVASSMPKSAPCAWMRPIVRICSCEHAWSRSVSASSRGRSGSKRSAGESVNASPSGAWRMEGNCVGESLILCAQESEA